MIIQILTWYLVLQIFAFVGLPLALRCFHKLPSRGYAASKAFGLLAVGILYWWGGILHFWDNGNTATLSSMLVILILGFWSIRSQWGDLAAWLREQRSFVFITELLFLGMLVLWAVVRASQPELQTAGGEKWMEIAFLNAVLRSPQLPPHDPWLSGYSISYYYFGYVLLGIVTRLSALPASIAFNLGAAAWFAMTACVSYNIVYDLLPKRDAIRPLLAPLLLLLTGNAEGFLELLHAQGKLSPGFWTWIGIGKLSTPPQPPYTSIPNRFFWWWQASRTLRDCAPWNLPWATCTGPHQLLELIDEFPAFSFILGDMHPHVLGLPFMLLAVLLGLHIYRSYQHAEAWEKGQDTREDKIHSFISRYGPLAGYALLLGALAFINTWDFPIYWAVVVGSMILSRYVQSARSIRSLWDTTWSLLPEAIVLGVFSIVFYFPFWISLRSQAGGILPNLFFATRLRQFVVMFFPLIFPVGGFVVSASRYVKVKWYNVILVAAGLIVGIASLGAVIGFSTIYPYLLLIAQGESVQGLSITPDQVRLALKDRLATPWTALLLACGVSAVVLTITGGSLKRQANTVMGQPLPPSGQPEDKDMQDAKTFESNILLFPLLLTLLGLLLTLAPEFVYLKDVFLTRMNTIFKFYFQAWVLWSLVGAWQLATWISPDSLHAPRRWHVMLSIGSILFIAVGLVYTVLAVPARSTEQGTPWTLDGAAWVSQRYPADYQAIQWLNQHVATPAVIIESPGDSHRAYVYEGRVSALTGLPTLLGWGGHQLQWRGNYELPAQREFDIQTLYNTTDGILAREILNQYGVTYIYIGLLERQRYDAAGLMKFQEMFPTVYDRDGVQIFAVDS